MEKPLSYFDWELHFRNSPNPAHQDTLSQEDFQLKEAFKNLLRCFSKRESIIRSGGILSSQFNFLNINLKNGIINCVINNQSLEEFKIQVNKKKKFINHKCQEFRNLNKFKKYFCSHLIRLFFILKEIDIKNTNELLKHISTHDYDFFPKIKSKKGLKSLNWTARN
ncbi:MAG: hypothetical protein ACFE8E_13010 [Candidatus Hodarchaeota archaeon]